MGEMGEWKRLHPTSPVFHLLGLIRAVLIAVVLVFVVSSGDREELWLALGLVVAAAFHLYRHFVTRYRLTEDELVMRSGVLFKSERHIPIGSIHNIELVRNPLARWLGVAEARVQTASGGEAEAVLRVLHLDDVARIRDHVGLNGSREPGEVAGEPASVGQGAGGALVGLGPGELVRLGLITNQGLVVFGGALGVAWQLDLVDFDRGRTWIERGVSVSGPASLALVVAGVVVAFMIFSVAISAARFWGFELRRVGEDFRISCGLFTQRSATIPSSRVQAVTVRSTPLHRVFGRVGVRVETAGGHEDEGSMFGRTWFVPLATPAESDAVLRALGVPGVSDLHLSAPAPGASGRMVKRAVFTGVPLGAAVSLTGWGTDLPVLTWSGVGVVVFAVWHALLAARRLGWCVDEGCVAFRSGVFYRSVRIARPTSGQVVEVSESPFDRRRGMASLVIDTAGAGALGSGTRIPYLARSVAEERALAAASRARIGSQGV
ncbi:MAG: PH domain-containing protein [Phycisphaerales bacterium JB040]